MVVAVFGPFLTRNSQAFLGTNLRTPALKTANLSKKSAALVKQKQNGFTQVTKRSSPHFSRVSCPGDHPMVLVAEGDFLLKGQGFRNDF